MKVSLYNIANFRVDGGAMFGVVPKVLWSRHCKPDENNLIVLTLRSMIVETGGHVILIDTGWGDKQDEKFFRHVYQHNGEGLIDGLRKRGYEPEDITDVFFTHLHADHCGGAVRYKPGSKSFEMTFPNAVHHVSRTQWDWAVKNNLREADSFLEENILPLREYGNLNLVDREGELFSGFSVIFCHGHTPGMMIPRVKVNGRTLVYTGDLIPTVTHIPLIWNMSYDLDSLRTIEEKKKVLTEALDNNHVLVFQHDETVECCTVEVTSKGIRAKDKFPFDDLG